MKYIILFLAIVATFEVLITIIRQIQQFMIKYFKDDEYIIQEKYYTPIMGIIAAVLWTLFYYLTHY